MWLLLEKPLNWRPDRNGQKLGQLITFSDVNLQIGTDMNGAQAETLIKYSRSTQPRWAFSSLIISLWCCFGCCRCQFLEFWEIYHQQQITDNTLKAGIEFNIFNARWEQFENSFAKNHVISRLRQKPSRRMNVESQKWRQKQNWQLNIEAKSRKLHWKLLTWPHTLIFVVEVAERQLQIDAFVDAFSCSSWFSTSTDDYHFHTLDLAYSKLA